jgi:hypothetical protein
MKEKLTLHSLPVKRIIKSIPLYQYNSIKSMFILFYAYLLFGFNFSLSLLLRFNQFLKGNKSSNDLKQSNQLNKNTLDYFF